MKKKIILGTILTSFLGIGLSVLFSNIDKKEDNFLDVINESELIEGQLAHNVTPKSALRNDELLKPVMGVQISSIENNKRAIRFIGMIQDLNVGCYFTRTMYDENGNVYKEENVLEVTTAYSSVKMGDKSFTPSDFGYPEYNYFVTYTLQNIPESYWYYPLDVKLDIYGYTSDNELLEETGTNKANIQGALKSYYNSTFDFTKLNNGTYEIAVKENALNEESYEIPEYYNSYEGNVAKKVSKVTSFGESAFKGCTNITSLNIRSSINNIGESAFKSCVNLDNVYYEGNIESWCNVTLNDEYSNPMSYANNMYMLNSTNEYELLTEIELPTTVKEVGDYQFYNFKNIKNLVLHDDIISFGEKAFYNFESLETLYFNGTIEDYKAIDFIDFHSDSSNYAKTFYVLNNNGKFEEYVEENTGGNTPDIDPTIEKISIKTFSGHLESAYAEWNFYKDATGYNVYYKLNSASSWTQVDTQLIRSYSNYVRVDAVGLKAGNYTLKIVPIVKGNEYEEGASTCQVTVKAHDRSGYAFVNGTASGAYNEDGTLKSNAVVVYVTNSNKNSISVTPNISDGGKSFTGFGNIVYNWKSKYDSRPLNIRMIGNIEDCSSLQGGDILIDTTDSGITIEGIGNDTVANGWGIRVKNSSNVEIRNIGFMNCNSSEGDSVGLQQGNNHIWVHNCDFFYGQPGSDADQVKGDGALDTKKSTYVTHSYNHFFDTGKTHLCAANASDTTNNYLTFHHNWYDHSDSRHPRVRTSSAVHIYNNYYDGNAGYGVGSTLGSSIFVEGNYFRNCNRPMLISKQGSDTGIFSGEDGGIIKAYDNIILEETAFVPYSKNNTDFDAYVVTSRDEKVPGTVKSKSGGNTYSNFDTASNFYDYIYESPESAKETVINFAGRVQGGDFKWTFNNKVDDESESVNSSLKSALLNYKTTLVSVGGNSISGDGGDTTINTSEITSKIASLNNIATLENINEIKEVYNEYLSYDKNYVSNASKIERLYEEALALEISHFEDLVSICANELTKTNLNNAYNYYETLSSSQKTEANEAKLLLDEYNNKYELLAGQTVYEMIEKLPSVDNVTLDDEENINKALEAYNLLTNEQKSVVTNYDKLQKLYSKIIELKNAVTINSFIESVNALPSKEDLTVSDLDNIDDLIYIYNGLDNEIKELIDESYINKLYDYKTYINDNLVENKEIVIGGIFSDWDKEGASSDFSDLWN